GAVWLGAFEFIDQPANARVLDLALLDQVGALQRVVQRGIQHLFFYRGDHLQFGKSALDDAPAGSILRFGIEAVELAKLVEHAVEVVTQQPDDFITGVDWRARAGRGVAHAKNSWNSF